MTSKILNVKVRLEYGNRRRYLGVDPIGQAVKSLTNRSTVLDGDIIALQALGITVKED